MVQADLKSQTVLVTGANGFVGHSLCVRLLQVGHAVCAAVRPSANFDVPGCQSSRIPSIDADTDWAGALAGVTTVIHLAARVHVMHDDAVDPLEAFRRVNVAGTERLALAAVASGVKRLVYVSSIKVNGEATRAGNRFAEADRPSPQDPYGVSKDEAEQALHRIAKQSGLEVVIVRPPLVYGAGVKGNFVQMLNVLSKGIPLPLTSIQNHRSLVYVENLVDALITCTTHPAAVGQTYLVSDGQDISTSDLLRELGVGMGQPARLFPCPPRLLEVVGAMVGKSDQVQRLLGSLQVDSGKIRRELNWTPPYSLQQGLQATAEWYRDTHL